VKGDRPRPSTPATRIGHVHLKVADLDRAIAFYSGVLGFEVHAALRPQAAFLSAGGYHHHIGLNTWESRAARRRRPDTPGSTTPPSSIPTARRWPMPCAASPPRASPSTAPPTTA
jgi:catechol-2,3-dioxygenase